MLVMGSERMWEAIAIVSFCVVEVYIWITLVTLASYGVLVAEFSK